MSSTTSPFLTVAPDFLVQQRAQLATRRSAYREQAERMTAAADGDPLDGDGERVRALTATATQRLEEVDAALRRLDRGTYGACRSCRRPIPVVRLEAVPEATQCVRCASGGAFRRRELQ